MWTLMAIELIATLDLQAPLELGAEPVSVALLLTKDKALRKRIVTAARDPARNAILVLRKVETDAAPDASWEVYVEPAGGAPCDDGRSLLGVMSLYGMLSPAEFSFPLDDALAKQRSKALQVTFKPTSGLVVEGAPSAPVVRSTVRIGEISLAVDAVAQP